MGIVLFIDKLLDKIGIEWRNIVFRKKSRSCGENIAIYGKIYHVNPNVYAGNNVKIYQGVTLGALSTRMGQQLSGVKRHPTIEDNVTIYSNASILGGETVIGAGSIIGGSAFIIESVPPNTRVSVKNPELTFKSPRNSSSNWDI